MDKIFEFSENGEDYTVTFSINMKEKLQYNNPELKNSLRLAIKVIAKCFKLRIKKRR